MSQKSDKPSLAEIISGRCSQGTKFRKPSKEHNVHRLLTVQNNDASSYLVNADSPEKRPDILMSYDACDSDSADAQFLTQSESFVCLNDCCEINRDNVLRVLDQMGIKNIPDTTVLESYFFNFDTGKASYIMPRKNCIALIQNHLGHQSKTNYDLPSELDERNINKYFLHPGRVLAAHTKNDNASFNRHMSNEEGHWVTGTEEGDEMLTKLFIHCGAQSRAGGSIKLYPGNFRNMIDLRRRSLPPSLIVEHVSEKLTSNMVGFSERAVDLHQFYTIIQGEIQGIWANYSARESRLSLPTLCILLVALAPNPMERICGTEVVEYLRSPKILDYVLRALTANEGSGLKSRHSFTFGESFPRKLEDEYPKFSRRRPPAPPPKCFSNTRKYSPIDIPVSRVPCSSLTNSTNDNLQRRGRSLSESSEFRGPPPPRYMEPKPIDEISASIIARSKARKLVDKLRQNAIPTNRSECFARIKYVQKLIFQEANLSEDEETDDDETPTVCEGSTEHGSQLRHRPASWRVRPTGISGPLLPGMYKMGGVGQPVTRRTHQQAFERLYRSRFSSHSFCSSSLRGGNSSLPYPSSENDTRCSSLHWGQGTGLHTLSCHAGAPMMGEHQSRRRSSRSSPMLADICTKRYFQYLPGIESSRSSQYQSPQSFSTTAVGSHMRKRRHTRPPVPRKSTLSPQAEVRG